MIKINDKNKFTKKIINAGYLYFDYLNKNILNNYEMNTVLIAPSWSKHYKNYINESFDEVIEYLLIKNYKVIFRPHPEHLKDLKIF